MGTRAPFPASRAPWKHMRRCECKGRVGVVSSYDFMWEEEEMTALP